MDINIIREAVTVISFIVFLGIVIWAYGKGSRRSFEQAALIPFEEDEERRDQSQGER